MKITIDHLHTPEAIARRLASGPRQSYVRDAVYGGIDGAVTTFAIVSGVVGAELQPAIILVLGVANLVGDGFSMAAANYSSTRGEREELQQYEAMEHEHIERDPEGEREEIRQIYRLKGFAGDQLEAIVDGISADRDRWVRTMLVEEHGQPLEIRSPLRAALTTFAAFAVCGLVPLLPFLFGLREGFAAATVLTLAVFFAIGSWKSRWALASWWRLGLETLAIGAGAAALAYGIGWALRGLA